MSKEVALDMLVAELGFSQVKAHRFYDSLYDAFVHDWRRDGIIRAAVTAGTEAARKAIDESDKIQGMDRKIGELDRKVGAMDHKIDDLDNRLTRVETKVDHLDNRLTRVETKVDHLDKRLTRVETKVDSLETKMETRFDALEQDNKENRGNILALLDHFGIEPTK